MYSILDGMPLGFKEICRMTMKKIAIYMAIFGGYDFFCESWFSLIISSLPEKKSGNFSFSFGSELGST